MNIDHLLLSFVDLLLKSLAILILAFTVQHVWKKASAASLNIIWLMAFGALFLLPLTRLVQPRWATSLAEKKTIQFQALPMHLPVVQAGQVSGEMKISPAPAALRLPDIKQVLLSIWVTGAALVMARRMMGVWQLRRIKKQSVSLLQASTGELASRLAQEWGVSRPVELCESKEVPVPLTWGTLRPVLMLPHGAAQWKEERLLAALQHELGHIKRFDVLTRGLTDFVCALYWINPMVWLGAKAMRLMQERACDDLVLNAGVSAEGYATQLLESARFAQQRFNHRLPAVAMAQPSTLETRLLAIVDEERDRRPIGRKAQLFAGVAGILMLFMSATMQLRAEDQSPVGAPSKTQTPIVISVKVIEAPVGTAKSLSQGDETMSPEQSSQFIQKISALPKVDMLSAPTVTTMAGQKATVETGRDHVSKDKEKTFTGISIGLLPTVTEKHEIKLLTNTLIRELVSEDPKPLFKEFGINTEMVLGPDQTILLMGPPLPNENREKLFLISAKFADASIINATPLVVSIKSETQIRADKIIIPSVNFQEAPFEEAMEFLRAKAKEYDPAKKGINLVIKAPGKALSAKLTLDLKNIPLSEALRYVAGLSGMNLVFDDNACVFETIGATSKTSQNGAAISIAVTDASKGIATKAESIIIPHLEFSGAKVSEALDFLRVKSRQFDPDKKGINLIFDRPKSWDEKGGAEPTMSLSLKEVPLSVALRYVAELANLKITAEQNAYILSPLVGSSNALNKADNPLKIEAETVVTDEKNGVTQASGNVVFKIGNMTVKTDHLEYDAHQQKATANGRVEITKESNVTTALGRVEINLKSGAFTVNGTSTVMVK